MADFMEEGTTAIPFNMVVFNNISRYQLALEAIFKGGITNTSHVVALLKQKLLQHHPIPERLHDMPEIRNGMWS